MLALLTDLWIRVRPGFAHRARRRLAFTRAGMHRHPRFSARNASAFSRTLIAFGWVAFLASAPPALAQQPDLRTESCSLSRTEVLPGDVITVTADVCNVGGFGTATFWADAVYFNTSPSLTGATRIGGPYCRDYSCACPTPFIVQGFCYSDFSSPDDEATVNVTIPSSAAPGVYYVGYRANWSNSQPDGQCIFGAWPVGESSYLNNTRWTQIVVRSRDDVLYETKIGDATGTLGLSDGQAFGSAVTGLGDLSGDGVTEIAVGAAETLTGGTGSVRVLFLQSGGTVTSTVRIPQETPGFDGVLDNLDHFGIALEPIGDLDQDGVTELAIGADGDDDGGTDRGAVWILFLSADGQVKHSEKIGSNELAGIDDSDRFGASLAALGDLDQDGAPELLVGAPGDDDAGADSGSAWVLFLRNDGTVRAQHKISAPPGVIAGEEFGNAVAALGDMDGPGGSATSVAVGAWLHDHGGTDAGAVWLLNLDDQGIVQGQVEVAEGSAGFDGPLVNNDRFGAALASLGDIDGSGSVELAVSALDDDGGTDRGAVYVLSISAGAVVEERKLSDLFGNFGGTLDNSDLFGAAVKALGDFDRDGRPDMVVGAPLDDDGGANRGAAWILALNDRSFPLASTTTWVGGNSMGPREWGRTQNWTNGLPSSSRSAIIPSSANPPLLDDSRQCNGLLILPGGSLEIVSPGSERLTVQGGATLHGPITGAGGGSSADLQFNGPGSLGGATTIALAGPVTTSAAGDLSIQGGPLTLAGPVAWSSDIIVRSGAQVFFEGTAQISGSLVGEPSSLFDFEADATLSATCSTPPQLRVAADLIIDTATFTPDSGLIVFDGNSSLQLVSPSNLTSPVQLHDVEVLSDGGVSVTTGLVVGGHLQVDDGGAAHDLDVTGSLVIEGDVTGSGTNANITTGGNGAELRGIIASYQGVWGSSVTITNDDDVTATLNEVDGDLIIDVGGTCTVSTPTGGPLVVRHSLILQNGTLTTEGNLEFDIGEGDPSAELLVVRQPPDLGTLDVADHAIELSGSGLAVNVDGVLQVGAGGVLTVGAHVLTFDQGGKLQLLGTAGAPARMQGTESGYSLSLSGPLTTGTSVLKAQHFELADVDVGGARIGSQAEVQSLASGVLARRLFTTPGGQLLDLDLLTTPPPFDQLSFETNGTLSFNVVNSSASADVIFTNWGGNFGGPDHDSGTIEPIWGADLVYFFGVERSQGVDVFFRVLDDLRVNRYILRRAEYPGGTFSDVGVFAPTGRDHSHSDPLPPGRLPGQRYTYQLIEELQPGLQQSALGAFVTPGIVSPPSRPSARPPAPLPFTAADTPGTIVDPDTLAQTLASAPSGASLGLEPGSYRPFVVGRGVALVALYPGTVFVDTSSGPVCVEGLAAGETVELSGLLLDARGGVGPALVVRGCAGAVLLDALEVHAAERAPAVLLEDDRTVIGLGSHFSGSPALRLVDARALWFGDPGSTETSGSASLEVWGGARQASGQVSPYLPASLTLEPTDTGVAARLPLEPGVRWWLLSSPALDLDARAQTHPFVLGARAEMEARGQGPLDVRLNPTPSGRRYHQAVWLDPRTAELRVSTVAGMDR